MRVLRSGLLTLAMLSMSVTPVLAAAANPAAKLSLAPASARASAKADKSKLAGGFLIAAIAVVAVIAGVIIIANDDDEDSH